MQPLPGFRDFLPDDCAARNYIFTRWREVCRRYGFVEWGGPLLEPTELYKKKSGPEIVAQLFNFTDKGDREVALRPELTPTLARVVAAHEREFRKPLKWFSVPQCFRYEKQQRGRLREHFQLNCDIIGEASLAADTELIALSIDLLRAFGFTEKDFVVRVSDREFWSDLLRAQSVPEERWGELLQVIDKSGREPREKTAERLGPLSAPVLAVLDGGGRSERLDQLDYDVRWATSCKSISPSCAAWLTTPASSSSSSIAQENSAPSPVAAATTISSINSATARSRCPPSALRSGMSFSAK
jgi:histidyl-tRNA synthetase